MSSLTPLRAVSDFRRKRARGKWHLVILETSGSLETQRQEASPVRRSLGDRRYFPINRSLFICFLPPGRRESIGHSQLLALLPTKGSLLILTIFDSEQRKIKIEHHVDKTSVDMPAAPEPSTVY